MKLRICLTPKYAYEHFGTFQENKHESSLLIQMEEEHSRGS